MHLAHGIEQLHTLITARDIEKRIQGQSPCQHGVVGVQGSRGERPLKVRKHDVILEGFLEHFSCLWTRKHTHTYINRWASSSLVMP